MLAQLSLAVSVLASATVGWTPTGVKVIDGSISAPLAVTDESGGAYVAWYDKRLFSLNYGDAYGQRVLAIGSIHPLWPLRGTPIANNAIPLDEGPVGVTAGRDGSAYWVWQQRTLQLERDIMLKRTLADGTLDPAWPAGGVDVNASLMDVSESRIAPDGLGGALITWQEVPLGAPSVTTQSVRCQRILADGSIAPGWPVGGVLIFSALGFLSTPEVVADGVGGAYVKYDHYEPALPHCYIRVQHIRADGSVSPGWPTGGVQACPYPSFQTSADNSLISDGAGGVYVAWDDLRDLPPGAASITGDIYMARLAPDGTRPPGWPADGVPLHMAPGAQWNPRLCPDGSGGALAVWNDNTTGLARITRITAAGTQAPGWPFGGTVLCTAEGYPNHPHIASDGQGGAYAGWLQEQGLVRAYAQHFRGDGALAPGWAMTGTLMVDLPNASQNSLTIVPGDLGAAIMVWKDIRDADTPPGSIRAQKLVTDGLVPVQLALQSAEADANSVRLTWWGAGVLGESFFVERSPDGETWARLGAANTEGTERLTFEDRDVRAGDRLAYRLVDASNRVIVPAAWVEVPRALEFALAGARPNPARLGALTVELSLAEQANGTLELLDLAGRRVAWRELASLAPGRHTIPFPETASLAPGMHWLRLRQGVHEKSARVALTR